MPLDRIRVWHRPQGVLRLLLVIGCIAVLIVLAILYYPVLQGNTSLQADDSMKRRPILVTISLDEGRISPDLQGVIESDAQFYKDMEDTALNVWGVRMLFPQVQSETASLVRLSTLQTYDNLRNYYYPGQEFCIRLLSIRPLSRSTSALKSVDRIVDRAKQPPSTELALSLEERFSKESCPTPNGTILFNEAQLGIVPMATTRSSYFYPFDSHSLELEVMMQIDLTSRVGITRTIWTSPNLKVMPQFRNWETTVSISEHVFPSDELAEEMGFRSSEVQIVLQRPITYRILVPIILFAFGIIILSLGFIADTGSFLEVSVAVLLGLWGIQGVLVPPEITGPTILSPILMGLYVLFMFSLLVRFVARPLWQRLDDQMAIPNSNAPASQAQSSSDMDTIDLSPNSRAKKGIAHSRTSRLSGIAFVVSIAITMTVAWLFRRKK